MPREPRLTIYRIRAEVPDGKMMLETAFSEVVKTLRADRGATHGVICRLP
jgi:hypothetical protein